MAFPFIAHAQQQGLNLNIGQPVEISTATDRITSEGSLSMDPNDPEHLAYAFLSAKIVDNGVNYFTQVIETFDRGKSWKHLDRSKTSEAADPWCMIKQDGSILMMDISEGSKYHLTTQLKKTSDQKWQEPYSYGYRFDHGMIIRSDWSDQFLTMATQAGTSDSTVTGSTLMLKLFRGSGDNGQRLDVKPFQNAGFNAKNAVFDLNDNICIPILIRDRIVEGQYVRMEHYPLWMIRLNEYGHLMDAPGFITDQADNRHHWLIGSNLKNGEHHLHLFYTSYRKSGIYHQKSIDGGMSWLKPVRIDNGQSKWSDLASAAVNKNGILIVIWTERMSEGCYQKFVSVSNTRGASFTNPIALHKKMSCPDSTNGWVRRAWPQGGDYCGTVAVSESEFITIWSGAQSGQFKLYQNIISMSDE